MLIDMANAVGGYLHDVFIGTADWGILVGYVAQAMFAMRFVVQCLRACGKECCAHGVLGFLDWRRTDAARLCTLQEGPRVHYWAGIRRIRLSAQSAICLAQRRDDDGGRLIPWLNGYAQNPTR